MQLQRSAKNWPTFGTIINEKYRWSFLTHMHSYHTLLMHRILKEIKQFFFKIHNIKHQTEILTVDAHMSNEHNTMSSDSSSATGRRN